MNGEPAPQAVLELLSCQCSRACELPRCTCLSNGLRCTPLCKLVNCSNQRDEEEEEESQDEIDEESDDETECD